MSIPTESDKPFKPITFSRYIWERCKSQPLIPLGCIATVGALVGATVSLRIGNRRSFNQWLRFRVVAQGATVLAMVIYGSVALTRDQQNAHYIKSQVLLGDLPADTPWPGRKPGEGPTPRLSTSTPSPSSSDKSTASGSTGPTAAGEPPSAGKDATTGPAGAYPLPLKDRMKASEFARRLKEAERMQKDEDDAKKAASQKA